MITKTFDAKGDFVAIREAEDWCKEQGVSVGSMQRDDPMGLMWGDVNIAKWRNLTPREKRELHGTLEGDKRNGPVIIRIIERPA